MNIDWVLHAVMIFAIGYLIARDRVNRQRLVGIDRWYELRLRELSLEQQKLKAFAIESDSKRWGRIDEQWRLADRDLPTIERKV